MSHSPPQAPRHDTPNTEHSVLKAEEDNGNGSVTTSAPTTPAPGPTTLPTAPTTTTVDSISPPYSAFSRPQRRLIIALGTIAATFSGFASNIYFPAIPRIAHDLGTSVTNINLTVTSYMVFQALTPTLWGALSDVYGRRVALLSTFVVFIGASIGLARAGSFVELLVLRALQSSGSASTIAIGAGMVGDVVDRAHRGGVMGVFQAGLLMPLAIGPVLGGVITDSALGWRGIFWFLVIYGGTYLVVLAVALPETLRALVGDGSVLPRRMMRAPLDAYTAPPRKSTQKERKPLRLDIAAPLRILAYPEVFVTLLFLALHYGTWNMALTAQSTLFASTYALSDLHIGLTFLSNGLGCMLGTLTTGKILDRDYARLRSQYSGTDFPLEHARLRTVWLWSPAQCAALLTFGWAVDRGAHLAAPVAASFVLAWGAMSVQAVVTTYVVDVFPGRGASATAALNLARCLVGAAATAAVEPTMRRIGVGGTFSLWTGMLALSLVLVGVQQRWGGVWRRRREAREREREGGGGDEVI